MSTDVLRFLLSPFAEHMEIMRIPGQITRVHYALTGYRDTGLSEYLTIALSHMISLIEIGGIFAAKLRVLEKLWTQESAEIFASQMGDSFQNIVNELASTLKVARDLFPETDAPAVQAFCKKYVQLIASFELSEKFPSNARRKVGVPLYGLIQTANEIRSELVRRRKDELGLDSGFYDANLPKPEEILRRRYSSLADESFFETVIPKDSISDIAWGEDEIEDLLEKIDFNDAAIGKAVVRVGGCLVCIAGTLGKIASVVTVNPILNDISIKAMVVGGAFAVSPSVASKLAQKFLMQGQR